MHVYSSDMDFVGLPATILSWLSLFEIVNMNPMLDFTVSICSLIWLSLQIFTWAEKRIKNKKDASQ
jgi:hypothetical protein